MRAYRVIGRLISPILIVLFYLYNVTTRRPRSRVVVRNEDGDILLVENWVGHRGWGFPGGGVKRKEDPRDAAVRELFEETGIAVRANDLEHVLSLQVEGYTAEIYTVTIFKERLPHALHNPREITNSRWFKLDALPHVAPLVTEVIGKLALKS